jgi:glycerate 2-kinase
MRRAHTVKMTSETSKFITHSINKHPLRDEIVKILNAALKAVDPYQATLDQLRLSGVTLRIPDKSINLNGFERIFVVGAGKAGAPMAMAVHKLLGQRVSNGIVIVKDGHLPNDIDSRTRAWLREASHPLPDERGINATQAILRILDQTTAKDLIIVLVSGGGSALLTAPVPGVSLENLRILTNMLIASGANIHEINTIRKHLDLVKGGKLARAAYPAQVLTLILSDVVGDSLEMIASGPTAPDTTTFLEAVNILRQYGIEQTAPASILAYLKSGENGEVDENPGDGDPVFERVSYSIIGSNTIACQAAIEAAHSLGMEAELLTRSLQGIARERGAWFAEEVRKRALREQSSQRPLCLVAGGETTVNLEGDGLGGRNQEFALAAVAALEDLENVIVVTMATDGGDGPTDAAGAAVTGDTLQRARNAGLHPEEYLRRNDSYHFFKPLGDLLITGPTRTNVNDLVFAFIT